MGLAVILNSAAWASLGGGAASIGADAAEMGGRQRAPITHLSSGYSVCEISGESSMDIHEFLNSRGVVFAVSWSGPVLPDLRLLLGPYFGRYADSLAALDHAGVHRSVRLTSPELVVESGGHLRAYHGLAYLPSELPAGLSPMELQ